MNYNILQGEPNQMNVKNSGLFNNINTNNLPNLANVDNDHSTKLYDSLPENAKKYYKEKSQLTLDKIVSDLTKREKFVVGAGAIGSLGVLPLIWSRYVNGNQVIPMLINGKHKLLKGPGFFWVSGITDRIGEPVDISQNVIFGSIKLIYVKPGTLRYALDTEQSKPILLGPGMHFFDDNTTVIDEGEIVLSSNGQNTIIPVANGETFNFVFVKTGFQGVVNTRNGDLKILNAGLHFIESPDSFVQFASIQQEHFKFGSCDKTTPVFLTADNIELHVDATIFYNISDVKKVFTNSIKDQADLYETLHSQAMATLMTIIRSENFSNIGKRRMDGVINNDVSLMNKVANKSDIPGPVDTIAELIVEQQNMPAPSAPPVSIALDQFGSFGQSQSRSTISTSVIRQADTLNDVTMGFQSIIHDAEPRFKENLQTNFGDRLGFTIQSLRIERIEFADKTMQKQVSELAMTFTKLSSQEMTIAAQRKVQVAEAERDAATLIIKTRADADKKILMQKADNDINKAKVTTDNELLITTTNAQMEALKMQTDVEARNKKMLAIAEAEAILSVGNAEVEIIEKKNKLPNSELRIIADSQVSALKGVSKVVYTNKEPFIMQDLMTVIGGATCGAQTNMAHNSMIQQNA